MDSRNAAKEFSYIEMSRMGTFAERNGEGKAEGEEENGEENDDGIVQNPYERRLTLGPDTEFDSIMKKQLNAIFDGLVKKFGFQESNKDNMFDYLISLWESRSCRMREHANNKSDMLTIDALLSIYKDYIWGPCSNFTKWYTFVYGNGNIPTWMLRMTHDNDVTIQIQEMVLQLSLWLLIWGEANNLRVMPELLCFIFDLMNSELYLDSNAEEIPKKNLNCNGYILKQQHLHSPNKVEINDGTPLKNCPNFLIDVVNPIYEFIQFQLTWNKKNDHSHIIGYDDINQCFWTKDVIKNFKLKNGENYYDLPPEVKYHKFNEIEWSKSLRKTFKESRTWLHLITNFHRIWVLHFSTFWYFSVLNLRPLFTRYYAQSLDNEPELSLLLNILSFAGIISCVITLIALIGEIYFIPKDSNLRIPLLPRLLTIVFLKVLNSIPIIVCFTIPTVKIVNKRIKSVLSFISLLISILTSLYLSIAPLSDLIVFKNSFKIRKESEYRVNNDFSFGIGKVEPEGNIRKTFIQFFSNKGKAKLKNPFTNNWAGFDSKNSQFCSIALWSLIWISKFWESYFFLCSSIKDPATYLFLSKMNCSGNDSVFNSALCLQWPKMLLALIIITNFMLFILDTYLWFVIYNALFSLMRSIYLGTTVLMPWRNVYLKLTNRIKRKLLPWHQEWDIEIISFIWNEIIYSMYRENLIANEHLERLIFHKTNENTILKPSILASHDDHFFHSKLFKDSREVHRRLRFFAQSLHCPLPDPDTIERMPTFTVLIPHYKEKILLSLKDIIKGDYANSNITLLEYLKLIYPTEWSSYIEETNRLITFEKNEMELAETNYNDKYSTDSFEDKKLNYDERSNFIEDDDTNNINFKTKMKNKNNSGSEASNFFLRPSSIFSDIVDPFEYHKIPYKFAGFKLDIPEQTIRTRIWASSRTQTLYRTINGFMKYVDAIRILHQTEKEAVKRRKTVRMPNKLNKGFKKIANLDPGYLMAIQKFHMVCSMQRMNEFSQEEKVDRNLLLTQFPSLEIAYIDEETDKVTGKKFYYSCLIDGYCDLNLNGDYIPKYRIKLSGFPILGNGKSDNQNHAIIFTRGEFIQLVDANQDNYLEECLKIKNVLKEFELNDANYGSNHNSAPVAIVGTREHIFSQNNGILGDIAAGKEQVFGTFFSRTMGYTNSKLHYGHPDFINSVYMTTRGGVSKTQRGLHLNEDIYVGMNMIMRGARIKHCEYYQCGKGRDLSFNSILNFTIKIGSGMGEQLLSREYYFLGTSLQFDRFLSFYYAHPGFHLNNVFIYISLGLLLIIILNLAVIIDSSVLCIYKNTTKRTDPWIPENCLQLAPVLYWLRKSTVTILVISMISFLPLFLQHLNDNGFLAAFKRLLKQLISGGILFEIFYCRISSQAMISDLLYGDAKYLATNRGLSFERIPFITLFTKFVNETIYFAGICIIILVYASIVMWDICLLYYWVFFFALILSPFLFNPNQFYWNEFIQDYRKILSWFIKWRKDIVWSNHMKNWDSLFLVGDENEAKWLTVIIANIWCHIIPQIFMVIFTLIPFILTNINNTGAITVEATTRIIVVILIPIGANALSIIALFLISIIHGIFIHRRSHSWIQQTLYVIQLSIGFISIIFSFLVLSFFQRWEPKDIVLGMVVSLTMEKLFYQLVVGILVPFQCENEKINVSWWTGKWLKQDHSLSTPLIEYFHKIFEIRLLTIDFILAHLILIIQVPFLLVPDINRIHSLMLFWRKAELDARPILFRTNTKKKRIVKVYSSIFTFSSLFIIILCIIPLILSKLSVADTDNIPSIIERLIQPTISITQKTKLGLSGYHNLMKMSKKN